MEPPLKYLLHSEFINKKTNTLAVNVMKYIKINISVTKIALPKISSLILCSNSLIRLHKRNNHKNNTLQM